MGKYDAGKVEGVSRRTMVLFFLIDKSISMFGTKIEQVNDAMDEVIPDLRELSRSNTEASVKIAAITFSTGAEWMYPTPIDVEEFRWKHISASGVTDLGEALNMLNEKLSTDEFMTDAAGSYAPAIFLLSDGQPNDDWRMALENLKKNNWYKHALKAAVAIGDDVDKDMLAKFTGNKDTVLKVEPEALKQVIKFVSVTSSQIGSKSTGAGQGSKTKQEEFAETIADFDDSLLDSTKASDFE
jgi:uncharacterized protein YegL